MIGGTVGEVVASRHPKFAPGDSVVGMGGWQLYSVADGSVPGLLRKVDTRHVPLSAYLFADILYEAGLPGDLRDLMCGVAHLLERQHDRTDLAAHAVHGITNVADGLQARLDLGRDTLLRTHHLVELAHQILSGRSLRDGGLLRVFECTAHLGGFAAQLRSLGRKGMHQALVVSQDLRCSDAAYGCGVGQGTAKESQHGTGPDDWEKSRNDDRAGSRREQPRRHHSRSLVRKRAMLWLCSWQTRLSVTPRTTAISFRFMSCS
jgi:hypothetical protein